MMLSIKEKILSLCARKLVKTHRVLRTSVGFQQAQNMGILYSSDCTEKHETIRDFSIKLEKMNKKVTILCYALAPLKNVHLDFPAITHHDFQIWGTITHPQAQDFVNTPFDYLYQVDLKGHPMLDYLLAKSQAKCRVGYYDTLRTGLFEIMVTFAEENQGDNIDNLVAQMVRYTKMLRAQ